MVPVEFQRGGRTIDEQWKPVVGFEGFYEVSNLGRVRSLDRVTVYGNGVKRIFTGRILTPCDAGKGYRNVMLQANGKRSTPRVCRVVAKAWIPNPDDLPQVNHKDEDKTNDAVDNLEWCSAVYNTNYGTGIERRASKIRRKVNQYDLNGCLIKEWDSISEASQNLGIDNSHITRCCKGRLKQTGGFKWDYV